jgi:hypothetical protein
MTGSTHRRPAGRIAWHAADARRAAPAPRPGDPPITPELVAEHG